MALVEACIPLALYCHGLNGTRLSWTVRAMRPHAKKGTIRFMPKVVLIGFMGTGKSTVAKGLATLLGAPQIEMDDLTVARSGLESIPQIFEKRGEPFFRDLESEVARSLAGERDAVISSGGGVIGRPENLHHLRSGGGVVVFLRSSFETVQGRNAGLETRPLFRDGTKAKQLFEARAPVYEQSADITIDTDGKAPDQVCAEILLRLSPSPKIDSSANLCLVIGDPIAHSLSPRMHNAAYAALGLPFLMAAAQVKATELQQTMRSVRALGIRGLAVTMPHKVEIRPMLDAIEPLARAVGAVNTVRNDNGVLTGLNTDVLGIVTPLERSGPLTGKRVALLGAGGAAQAAAHGCASRGAAVTIFNRSPEKARALASACGGTVSELGSSPDLSAFEIIINTTPVGMGAQSGESPIPASSIAPHHTVFETIYHPRTTQLVKDAELRGARVIRGLEMFIEQGLAQFEIHTAVKGARSAMEDALNSASAS